MNNVTIVGNLNNTNEVKMYNNLEILEFMIDGIKIKAFKELATQVKNIKPQIVYAEATIKLRDYTNKDGKTYPIQELVLKKIKEIQQTSVDNWESAKDTPIPQEELPFY